MARGIRNVHLKFLEEDPRFKKLEEMKKASGMTWEGFVFWKAGIDE